MKNSLLASITALIQSSAGQNMAKTAQAVLTFGQTDANLVKAVIDVVSPLAFSIILIYLLVGLIEQYMTPGKEITFDDILKAFVRLVIADVLVNSSYKLCELFMNFSNFIGPEVLNGASNAIQDAQAAAFSTPGGLNLIGVLIAFIIAIIGWLLSLLAMLIIIVMCASTKLEIMVRLAFAPVGLSSFANLADRTGATKYLKKLFACSLYGAAIAIVCLFATNLTGGFMESMDPTISAYVQVRQKESANSGKSSEDIMDELYEEAKTQARSDWTNSNDPTKYSTYANEDEYVEKNYKSIATKKMTEQFSTADGGFLNVLISFLARSIMGLIAPFAAVGAIAAGKSIINEAIGA